MGSRDLGQMWDPILAPSQTCILCRCSLSAVFVSGISSVPALTILSLVTKSLPEKKKMEEREKERVEGYVKPSIMLILVRFCVA